ncbi:hypothetical protein BDV95DRAFT_606979 [Massariosphaeria phaeospora]|uniref:Enoyl reductase (ER) domain-containing protein n=1 Tax=Massariosphaeria phaeospora TaxID=100035 RepID=A0A7C8MKI4_9PLEO|nr:hypothetical protein BDV95DRAFT_606979 [Massariosphaeria phaeospora]
MSPLPTHQKSLIFNTTTTTLSLSTTAPLPSPPNEHLLAVHSTAITNGELTWGPYVDWPTHHTPCFDVSGTILTTVPHSPFQPGDRVFGRVRGDRDGTAREFATILPSEAALVPEGLSMVDAASVPMSAHTAWQALFEHGGLTGGLANAPRVGAEGEVLGGQLAAGKRVLVLGAAGGVGLFAVQFAKLADAHVVGTASGRNEEFLKSIGIDEVVDYTKMSVEEWIGGDGARKFDLVFGCVGGDKNVMEGWAAVKGDGAYISVVPGFREPDGGKPEGVKSFWFIMEPRSKELEAIGRLMTKGLVKTRVDSVWRIEEYEKAFARTATGHARGKVVIQIVNDE